MADIFLSLQCCFKAILGYVKRSLQLPEQLLFYPSPLVSFLTRAEGLLGVSL